MTMDTSTKRPKVSIGMPVYNREPYIRAALDGVLNQTYRDFELLISDNASTDKTQEICLEYAARDPRIRYVRNATNLGMAGNYNAVFRRAVGEYFRWVAGDDLSDPESLAACVDVLDRSPDVVLCYPKTGIIDADGVYQGAYDDNLNLDDLRPSDRFMRAMKQIGLVNVHFGLMRSRTLGQTCLYHPGPGGDYAFIFELALHGRFVEIPRELFYRRLHAGSSWMIRQTSAKAIQDYLDPGRRGGGRYWWRVYGQFAGAIMRPPLPMTERLRALYFLARTMLSTRDVLLSELVGDRRPHDTTTVSNIVRK